MEYIKARFKIFESSSKKDTQAISDICIAMTLLNNKFLDTILDKGTLARYTHNSSVFINDLKNLILAKNRLEIGKFEDENVVSAEISSANNYFEEYSKNFEIENDWNMLVSARETARTIIDKLILDDKLTESMIETIFWTAPFKEETETKCDIVIKTADGRLFPVFINSKFQTTKTQSFNTFSNNLLDAEGASKLYTVYEANWDKLIQEWMRIIYENSKNQYRVNIEKFIIFDRMYSILYKDYFDIKVVDPEKQILGEHIAEFDKNYVYLYEFLSDMYDRPECFDDYEKVKNEWSELKRILLNSKILEHVFTEAFDVLDKEAETEKTGDGYIKTDDKLKMNFIKTFLDIIKSQETDIYYAGKKDFYKVPSREWFRQNYDELKVYYQLHNKVSDNEELKEDFEMIFKIRFKDQEINETKVYIGFGGGEMKNKLSAKCLLEFPKNFNFITV